MDFSFSDGTQDIGPEKLEFATAIKDKAHGYGFIYREYPLKVVNMKDPKTNAAFKDKLQKGQVEVFEKDGDKWFRAPHFVFDYTHYTDATKRFRCLATPSNPNPVCCQMLNGDQKTKRKPRILTLTVESALNKNGDIKTPFESNWEVRIFQLTQKVYDSVKSNNNKHPILNTDYFMTCTNPDYRDYTIAVGGRGATWRQNPETVGEILAIAEQHWSGLDYLVGKKITEDEFKELMGMAPKVAVNQELSEEQQEMYNDMLNDDL